VSGGRVGRRRRDGGSGGALVEKYGTYTAVYGRKRSNMDRFRAVFPRKRPYTAKSRLKIRLSVTINPDGRVGSGEAGGVSQINNINVRRATC
jgi:hypothetical protein